MIKWQTRKDIVRGKIRYWFAACRNGYMQIYDEVFVPSATPKREDGNSLLLIF